MPCGQTIAYQDSSVQGYYAVSTTKYLTHVPKNIVVRQSKNSFPCYRKELSINPGGQTGSTSE